MNIITYSDNVIARWNVGDIYPLTVVPCAAEQNNYFDQWLYVIVIEATWAPHQQIAFLYFKSSEIC